MDFQLPSFNDKTLFNYLKSKKMPVIETQLIRDFFPTQKDSFKEITLSLVQVHFLLYHHLHKLAYSLKKSDYVLVIHYIYIYLYKKPSARYCPRLDASTMRFCLAKKDESQSYCHYHSELEKELSTQQYLVPQPVENYYLNFDHFFELESEFKSIKGRAEKIHRFAMFNSDLEDHFQILGGQYGDSFEQIHANYKRLAKQYHPDLNPSPTAQQEFKKLSFSYSIVKEFLQTK